MLSFKGLALATTLAAALLAGGSPSASATPLVVNGGFEDTGTAFSDGGGGYMLLAANSTALPGWTVPSYVTGSITWGYSAITGFAALDGNYFLELTGLGDDSQNGAIGQSIATTPGSTYNVSLSIGNDSDTGVAVLIDGVGITLAVVTGDLGSPTYTSVGGSFTATGSTTSLVIGHATPGGFALYIDHVGVFLDSETPSVDVPEPASMAMLGAGFAALGLVRRRPRRAPRG